MEDQAKQIHDLVCWGGYSYSDVMSMPPFLRQFLLTCTSKSTKTKYKFEADIHGAKLEG